MARIVDFRSADIGSTPVGATKKIDYIYWKCGLVWIGRWLVTPEVAGSNPVTSAKPLWSKGEDTGLRDQKCGFKSC